MISTRYRIILLFLLNIGLILISKDQIIIFIGVLILFNTIFFKTVLSKLKILFLYILGLFATSLILNLVFLNIGFIPALINTIKIFTIINVSILLISDINIMEMVAFLSRIKIPTKIAISLGVGFRYFGLLVNDIKRINFVQSLNGYGFHYHAIKKNGIEKTTTAFLLPVFLNILKQVENISISISIQNIELRAKNFKFSRTTFIEFCLTGISLLITLYGVLLLFFLQWTPKYFSIY